jgi:hypothetical protein
MRRNSDYLIGNTYGKLFVLERTRGGGNGKHFYYLCKCECGNTKEIASHHIGKDTFSCGCLVNKDSNKKDALYYVYKEMKRRCYSPQISSYRYYGGKGIKVCSEWVKSYKTFKEWAIANGYKYIYGVTREERLSIDRIDSSKDYSPENCRWIPFKENRERSHAI